MSDDVGFVFNDPLDDLALLELHGFGNGGGEVDVILVGTLLAGDELNFGRISHNDYVVSGLISSVYARY